MDICAQTIKYLDDALGLATSPEPWLEPDIFPYYIIDQYGICKVEIHNCPCIFLLDTKGELHTPAQVQKHINAVQNITSKNVIYIRPSITRFDRKRLIERKIAFIVPGTQLYLPFMATDLRERYKKDSREKREVFNPATQRLLLSYLQNPEWSDITIRMAVQYLGYTGAAMSHAFSKVINHGIAQQWTSNKERHISFPISRRQLWDEVQDYLRSPVAQVIFIRCEQGNAGLPDIFIPAGLSALAQLSNLAEPHVPVYGIDKRLWKESFSTAYEQMDYACEGTFELQLWHYPVKLPHSQDIDRLSLYLSLKDDSDERLQGALRDLLEEQQWYQD